MAGLTQLEIEVLNHPSLKYFLSLPKDKLDPDNWARFAAHIDGQNNSRKDTPVLPSRIGKDWDEFSAHFRSILVLLAKINRDTKLPKEETLARDLMHKIFYRPEFCFRWEIEEHERQVALRRKGNMNLVIIEIKKLSITEIDKLNQIITQFVHQTFNPPDSQQIDTTEFIHHRSQRVGHAFNDTTCGLILLNDIPCVTALFKAIPRHLQRKIRIIRFRIPKSMQIEASQCIDILPEGFHIACFEKLLDFKALENLFKKLRPKGFQIYLSKSKKTTNFLIYEKPKLSSKPYDPYSTEACIDVILCWESTCPRTFTKCALYPILRH